MPLNNRFYNPDPKKRKYITLTSSVTKRSIKVFVHWFQDKGLYDYKNHTEIRQEKKRIKWHTSLMLKVIEKSNVISYLLMCSHAGVPAKRSTIERLNKGEKVNFSQEFSS